MSIEVTLDALAETAARYPLSYLITVGGQPHAHIGAVTARVHEATVQVVGVGKTGLRHVQADAAVTLLWPPTEPDGYALIVDGSATLVSIGPEDALEAGLEVVPVRAVLHRDDPASDAGTGSCGSDCVELPIG